MAVLTGMDEISDDIAARPRMFEEAVCSVCHALIGINEVSKDEDISEFKLQDRWSEHAAWEADFGIELGSLRLVKLVKVPCLNCRI
jgi:hypothetical protein